MVDVERPDWLQPGAKVVLYNSGRDDQRVVVTTTAKIGKQTFTVTADHEPRFQIRRCSANIGGMWGRTRYVVPFGSEEANKQLQGAKQRGRISRAQKAIREWEGDRSKKNRVNLIQALNELEAIPLLESAGITYYNPQVDEWYPDLVQIEAQAKKIFAGRRRPVQGARLNVC